MLSIHMDDGSSILADESAQQYSHLVSCQITPNLVGYPICDERGRTHFVVAAHVVRITHTPEGDTVKLRVIREDDLEGVAI